MKRSLFETLIGAFVVLGAFIFFQYSYNTAQVGAVDGYTLTANFSTVGGLKAGDDISISGVKVGTVSKIDLNPDTYLAQVSMTINNAIALPLDTAALISSEGLLGGLYLALEPGADIDMLEDGDQVEFTQSPQNLEQLLGQFIFSMQDKDKDGTEE